MKFLISSREFQLTLACCVYIAEIGIFPGCFIVLLVYYTAPLHSSSLITMQMSMKYNCCFYNQTSLVHVYHVLGRETV